MCTELNLLFFLFVSCLKIAFVTCDYDCLCNYNVETKVYSAASLSSNVVSYMYEFDCKPIFSLNPSAGFISIQIEHKIGYVLDGSGIKQQACQGIPDPSDKVTIQPPSVMATQPVTISTTGRTSSTITASTSTYPTTTTTSTTASTTTTTVTPTTTTTATPTTTSSTALPPTTPLVVITTTTIPPPPTATSQQLATTKSPASFLSMVAPVIKLNQTQPITVTDTMTTVAPAVSTAVYACFPGWVLYGESCYLFHTDARYTWEESEVFCRIHHSNLVSIETGDEQKFIETQLRNLLNPDTQFASVWTSGSDEDVEGRWLWTHPNGDKEIQSYGYENWAPTEPDLNVDDCLNLDGKLQFQWDDNFCDDEMYYICERSAHYHTDTAISGSSGASGAPTVVPVTTTTAPPATTAPTTPLPGTMQPTTQPISGGVNACFPGWTLYQESCYLFHTDSRYTWEESNTFCEIHHANLVAIESMDEQTFLQQTLSKVAAVSNSHGAVSTGLWTAGSDRDDEDLWMWINDLKGDRDIQGYDNWSYGQPDNGNGGGQNCLSLIGIRQFEWSDYNCDDKMFYICERSAHYHTDVANAIVG